MCSTYLIYDNIKYITSNMYIDNLAIDKIKAVIKTIFDYYDRGLDCMVILSYILSENTGFIDK